ncbi:MAG TPA: phage holin family protein [Pirellulales bacterium]|jgi:hypothetical protein
MSTDPQTANEPETLLGPLLAELAGLRAELRGAAEARWRLARLELGAALRDIVRLSIAIVVAALLALVSLPVLIVAVADLLAGRLGISRTGWLFIEFGALVLIAAATAWLSWRRFRSHFVGLEETLEVLREDIASLERMTGKAEARSKSGDAD